MIHKRNECHVMHKVNRNKNRKAEARKCTNYSEILDSYAQLNTPIAGAYLTRQTNFLRVFRDHINGINNKGI